MFLTGNRYFTNSSLGFFSVFNLFESICYVKLFFVWSFSTFKFVIYNIYHIKLFFIFHEFVALRFKIPLSIYYEIQNIICALFWIKYIYICLYISSSIALNKEFGLFIYLLSIYYVKFIWKYSDIEFILNCWCIILWYCIREWICIIYNLFIYYLFIAWKFSGSIEDWIFFKLWIYPLVLN